MRTVLEYPRLHAITTDEYFRMEGVFHPEAEGRMELIEGEIFDMVPFDSPAHAGRVIKLNRLFHERGRDAAIVSVHNPIIILDHSAPNPDISLLKPRADWYCEAHPRSSDVFLVVEIADTTLSFDVGIKVPLYARCGIAEVWVVDINAALFQVFRDPATDGFRASLVARAGDSVACAALPEVVVQVDELFPR